MGIQSARLLLICYLFLSEVAFTVFSLGDLFYPFGTSSGDITNLVSDDGSSPNISISTWFPFFERSYNSLYVNNNGVISFVVPVSQYTSTAFPLPDGRAFIAPFWADVDNRLGGNVYYRESTEEALLQRATADVRKYSPGIEFQARWVFVATWDNVTYYGSQSSKVNSFQAVLITDGLQSFIIFNYGNIEWTTGTASGGNASTGLGGTPAQAGFNSGDSLNFFSIPGSHTPEIIDIETTSNVDEPGRWVFRADTFKALEGCIDNGMYIRENQTVWVNGSCQTKCKCSSEGLLTCVSEPCGAAEICVPAPPFHACRPVSMKTCDVYGDPHYYTFDQRVIHFQGTCTYVLSELCDGLSDLTYYRVEGANENRGSVAVSFVRLVRLLVYGTEVIMLKGTTNYVLVNGTRSSVPVFLEDGRLQVRTAGFTMRATADFGLTVTYDGSHHASITLPGSYHGAVCGMCGNMNGDPSDDLRTRSGNLTTSPGIFGASWRVDGDGGGDVCRDSCTDGCGVCTEAERYSLPSSCGLLRAQNGPFRHCHAAIDPQDFEQSCVYDLCATGGLEASLCQALSSYAEACRSAGMRPEPWRTETFCGIRCPANSHYEACGNVCDRDCVFNSSTLHCNESCSEGCFCDPGYFRDGSECVPRDRCGCLHHGVYMKLGERRVSPECAEVCQCSQGRRVHCVPLGCKAGEVCTIRGGRRGCFTAQALCTVTGGGAQLLSFDGRPARLRGHCTHTLAEVCCNASAPWFRVTAEKWQEGEKAEGITRVRVQLVGADFVLERGRPPTMNETLISLPFIIPSVANLSSVGDDVIAVTASQLEVRFDGEGNIFVRVGPSYAGFLRGMCGNWNDDPSDDDLEPSRNGSEPRCEDNTNVTEPRCPQSPSFESQCSIILDIAGPFAVCHCRLDPENYYRSCVYDLCLHGSSGARLCRAITSYEKGCILEGVHVPAWRSPRICRELFYPFGTSSGDITNPVSDDGSSPNISISTWFPFFERSYNSLYVNNNGVISFVVPVSQYTSTAFPLPDGRAFIAPFWADVDNRLGGNVYYRESTEEALLQRATADVRKYSPGIEFQARWVFVATWDNVAYYGSQSSKVNSFQAVLITDGLQSFIIFNYGNIEWTTGAASGGNASTRLGGTPAQAGFNSGDSLNFFSIPGSHTPEIIDIETTSNVDEPGRWVFRADTFKALEGCIYNGMYVRENETVWVNGSCQTKCKCSSEGLLTCVSEPCGAAEICVPAPPFHACRPVSMKTCDVYGDPHYYTFDQRVIHFQGTCTYVLSELCDGLSDLTYYRVEGANENRGSVAVSFVRLVRLLVYGTEVIMLKGTTNYVLASGVRPTVTMRRVGMCATGIVSSIPPLYTATSRARKGVSVIRDTSATGANASPGIAAAVYITVST
ncbi:alpha-tectorin-like [Hypanus sabinus]|uniref:alpha-tectorin-like n=1 Tax=Hypanus sabinus TaxID=79690 RepID=UPI0028C48CD1|nr:alpha-tectorin-like [Hypanus sabinus]